MDETIRLMAILNATIDRRIYDSVIDQAKENVTFQIKILDMELQKEEKK